MRFQSGPSWAALIVIVAFLAAAVEAWTKEDYEIFRVSDEVLKHEGQTFYQFIGAAPGASVDQINAAYRRKSRQIHPDKAVNAYIATGLKYGQTPPETDNASSKAPPKPATKPTARQIRDYRSESQQRFARLGVVAGVLRGPGRDRYDYFLKNGFPVWRGTGYYYSRFRPGAGTVLTALFVFAGGIMHYGALFLSWKRNRAYLDSYIHDARTKASSEIPGLKQGPPASVPRSPATPAPTEEPAIPQGPINRKQRRAAAAQQLKEAKQNKLKVAKKAKSKASDKSNDASNPAAQDDLEEDDGHQPVGARRYVIGTNGKSLVVDSENSVFIQEYDSKHVLRFYHLDPEAEIAPTVWDTAALRLPMFMVKLVFGRFIPQGRNAVEIDSDDSGTDQDAVNPSSPIDSAVKASGITA